MKTLLFIFICLSGTAATGLAQSSNSSRGAKPSGAANAEGITWVTCQVTYNDFGHATAVMTKSTGSKALDDYILKGAGEMRNGPRGASVSIPIMCKVVETATPHGKSEVKVIAPSPPYPLQANVRREQGNGAIKISFDKSGRATGAAMSPSTGSKILDENTVNYAFAHWTSIGGEKVTTEIPVSYRLW